jgi:hypothetical protein
VIVLKSQSSNDGASSGGFILQGGGGQVLRSHCSNSARIGVGVQDRNQLRAGSGRRNGPAVVVELIQPADQKCRQLATFLPTHSAPLGAAANAADGEPGTRYEAPHEQVDEAPSVQRRVRRCWNVSPAPKFKPLHRKRWRWTVRDRQATFVKKGCKESRKRIECTVVKWLTRVAGPPLPPPGGRRAREAVTCHRRSR